MDRFSIVVPLTDQAELRLWAARSHHRKRIDQARQILAAFESRDTDKGGPGLPAPGAMKDRGDTVVYDVDLPTSLRVAQISSPRTLSLGTTMPADVSTARAN